MNRELATREMIIKFYKRTYTTRLTLEQCEILAEQLQGPRPEIVECNGIRLA